MNSDISQSCLIGYADGACKGLSGIGASSYAVLAIDYVTRVCHLALAGSCLWKSCTAIQAEMAAAAFLAKSAVDIMTSGRSKAQHSVEPIELNWGQGLQQLESTLSSQVVVAGLFEIA